MVQPARIEKPTTNLVKPADWNDQRDGHCGQLAIRAEVIGGVQYMRSAWDMEAIEALKLLCGARLMLGVSGHRHPVVHMEVAGLPEDFQPAYTVRRIVSGGGAALARVEGLFAHDGHSRMVYCEEPIGPEGLALAVGSVIDQIEELVRRGGLNA